jgi:ribonucleoside-diphosphate reductase alpha chain
VKDGEFDYQRLFEITRIVTRNLNKIIDRNYYPVEEARRSNMATTDWNRCSGFGGCIHSLEARIDSEEARQLNRDIFETIISLPLPLQWRKRSAWGL